MIESGDVKRLLLGEGERLGEAVGRVAVIAEKERAINPEAMPAQVGQRLVEPAAHCVEGLVHVPEILRIQALEPDEHSLATAARQQFQEFHVVRRVDARLADPADAERNQRTKEFLRLLPVRRYVVTHKEEQLLLALQRPQFAEDVIDGPPGLSGLEDRLHGAEITLEMA